MVRVRWLLLLYIGVGQMAIPTWFGTRRSQVRILPLIQFPGRESGRRQSLDSTDMEAINIGSLPRRD